MKIINLKNLSAKDYCRIMRRSLKTEETLRNVSLSVNKIIKAVKKDGDQAVIKLHKKRYGKNARTSFATTPKEVKAAYSKVNKNFLTALRQMMKNITKVHQAQLRNTQEPTVRPEKGIKVWRVWRPIEKVGIYIPGGKAIYPSSLLMTAIPAKIAGCQQIIVCTPPDKTGKVPDGIIAAANLLKLKNIFCLNGVAAITAMAYGTETVPKVDKIFGAGGAYVTAAKMAVFGDVAIDMPAGPSEVFVIADETANPAFIAADLLADGEHGSDSACVLLTTSESLAKKTASEIEKQLKTLPTADRVRTSLKAYGLLAVVESLKEAITFANEYAPEHLEIMTKNPERVVEKIINAGSVFLGPWTTKSAGDYATGANHILPTGGMAKMYPPLGIDAFGKWMQVQKCSREGLSAIRNSIEAMSGFEQLPAHKLSTEIRFSSLSSYHSKC